MEVRTLMTSDPNCCVIDQSANDAARIMWERDCGVVPVLDEQGKVAGVVTDRDICMAAYFQGEPLSRISLADIMSREPCCCSPSDDVADAERMMRERQIRRLPVVDEAGTLVGMLSLGDVAQTVKSNGNGAPKRRANGAAETDQELLATVAAVSTPRNDQRISA